MKKSILSNPAFRYIFEVIVIVFSVTLSFYIQDVLNQREKIELKNESLNGVLADLNEDLEGFNEAQKYLANRIKISEEFLSGQISNEYINQILGTYGFLGIDSNYKSLVSTGAIEFVNDKLLIKELTSYYEINYSVLKDLSEQYRHFYLDIFDFITSKYPIESMNKISLVDDLLDQGSTSFKYNKKTLLKLNQDFEIKNHVYSLKRIIIFYIRFYQQAIERNKKLTTLIENELNK